MARHEVHRIRSCKTEIALADLARERGLDAAWVLPLDGAERAAIGQSWRDGSVRRLRRMVGALLRERDLRATRN